MFLHLEKRSRSLRMQTNSFVLKKFRFKCSKQFPRIFFYVFPKTNNISLLFLIRFTSFRFIQICSFLQTQQLFLLRSLNYLINLSVLIGFTIKTKVFNYFWIGIFDITNGDDYVCRSDEIYANSN